VETVEAAEHLLLVETEAGQFLETVAQAQHRLSLARLQLTQVEAAVECLVLAPKEPEALVAAVMAETRQMTAFLAQPILEAVAVALGN
jgi:hypothetical protein